MNILKKLRYEAGIKQSELAKKINVDQTQISRWESSKAMPGLNNLIKLSRFYQINRVELAELLILSSSR